VGIEKKFGVKPGYTVANIQQQKLCCNSLKIWNLFGIRFRNCRRRKLKLFAICYCMRSYSAIILLKVVISRFANVPVSEMLKWNRTIITIDFENTFRLPQLQAWEQVVKNKCLIVFHFWHQK
jgi:hypothetical protein